LYISFPLLTYKSRPTRKNTSNRVKA
jgi:hypothetical protein